LAVFYVREVSDNLRLAPSTKILVPITRKCSFICNYSRRRFIVCRWSSAPLCQCPPDIADINSPMDVEPNERIIFQRMIRLSKIQSPSCKSVRQFSALQKNYYQFTYLNFQVLFKVSHKSEDTVCEVRSTNVAILLSTKLLRFLTISVQIICIDCLTKHRTSPLHSVNIMLHIVCKSC
jgi:hypothetical protein